MSRLRRWLRSRRGLERAASGTDLSCCSDCGKAFAYPVTWTESGPADWWILLRCGSCDAWRDVVASNPVVAAYDRILDEDLETIRVAAARLERAALSAEADTLGRALRLDLLTADDFR
jgi:hypothetical protein